MKNIELDLSGLSEYSKNKDFIKSLTEIKQSTIFIQTELDKIASILTVNQNNELLRYVQKFLEYRTYGIESLLLELSSFTEKLINCKDETENKKIVFDQLQIVSDEKETLKEINSKKLTFLTGKILNSLFEALEQVYLVEAANDFENFIRNYWGLYLQTAFNSITDFYECLEATKDLDLTDKKKYLFNN